MGTGMGNRKRLTEFWWGILKVRDLSGYVSVNWKNNIEMNLTELVLECMDCGRARGPCERGDEIWVGIKRGEILQQLNN